MAHGAEMRELLNNDRRVFAEIYAAYLEDLSNDDIACVKAKVGTGLFELPRTDCNVKVKEEAEEFRSNQLKSQLFRLWKEKTKTKNPREWSSRFRTPILCLVPTSEYEQARKAFDTLNNNWGTDIDIHTAIRFLETTRLFEQLSDDENNNAAFKRDIVGAYSVLLSDLDKVRDALDHLSIDVYDWLGHPTVKARIEELLKLSTMLEEATRSCRIIDNMEDSQLRQYLKELIEGRMAVGIEILENGG